MIRSVTVTNYRGESVSMGIGTPDESGFLISNIDGISPGAVDINTDSTAILDGSKYNSSKFPEREIVIYLYYYPSYVTSSIIEELRHLSYLYFPIKKKVRLKFDTDERLVWIEGYVSGNEVDIFSDQESAQITIKCPDPYFRTDTDSEATLSTVIPLFEFPFSNESLDYPFIEFGELSEVGKIGFFYQGDVDTGAVFNIHANKPIKDLEIRNTTTDETLTVNVSKIGQITKVYEYGSPVGLQGSEGQWITDQNGNTISGSFFKKVNSEIAPVTASDRTTVTANSPWVDYYFTIDDSTGQAIQGSDGEDLKGSIQEYQTRDDSIVEAEVYPGMIDGDTLIVSTIRGDKYAYLVRDGIKYNVINAIERTRSWIQVVPGYNTFECSSDNPDDLEISITYPVLYSGV